MSILLINFKSIKPGARKYINAYPELTVSDSSLFFCTTAIPPREIWFWLSDLIGLGFHRIHSRQSNLSSGPTDEVAVEG